MEPTLAQALLLVAGGVVAGVVNTLAGGGSLLTVPLLVLLGVPGGVANGTNRVGILLNYLSAAWRFRREGFFEPRLVVGVALPVVLGALLGAFAITRVADDTFEKLFGAMMLLLLVPTLRQVRGRRDGAAPARPWPRAVTAAVFFSIGAYAGAFQAGVGIPTLFALLHAGHDVVRANAIKVGVLLVSTAVAIPVLALEGKIAWLPAALLAAGFTLGGSLGASATVRGGGRLVGPVLAVAVVALAARMLGLF